MKKSASLLRFLKVEPVSSFSLRIYPFRISQFPPATRTFTQFPRKEKDIESIAEIDAMDQPVNAASEKRSGDEMNKDDYRNWSHEGLLQRVEQLERELKEKNASVTKQTVSSPNLPTSSPQAKSKKTKRSPTIFDPSKYSTRLIALKLSYLGKEYNGFEHHVNNVTPLPTIEEELWAALMKARLIFPTMDQETRQKIEESDTMKGVEVNWEGCEYSKCGRTDKGVSAFGQVIGLRVRSNRPLGKSKKPQQETEGKDQNSQIVIFPGHNELETRALPLSSDTPAVSQESNGISLLSSISNLDQQEDGESDDSLDYSDALDFDHIRDEIPYATTLNRLLPPTIRILAWCPSPPLDFSARFSCRERQYKYFFTQPAFAPSPLSLNQAPISSQLSEKGSSPVINRGVPDGWLDIQAMRTAAKYFEGTHDFRNFCKIDGGKQISNFERHIFKADIEEVDAADMGSEYAFSPDFLPPSMSHMSRNGNKDVAKVYTFTLHGSAFLWHQVRHMVAVLFLVGQGLEDPTIIKTLMDVGKTPSRPNYEMASDTPLVLWDCIFPKSGDVDRKDALDWCYVGDDIPEMKFGGNGALMEDMWKVWRERKIDEVLAGSLMGAVARQGNPLVVGGDVRTGRGARKSGRSQRVFDGGDLARLTGTYTPVMKKPLLDTSEVVNDKYARRKGFGSSEEMREAKKGERSVVVGFGGLKD